MKRVYRLLIVDDSVAVIRMLAQALSSCPGLEVVAVAEDGDSALSSLESGGVDCVLLDMELPKNDGMSTLRRIRAWDAQIPVVLFGSVPNSGDETLLQALSTGTTDYALKPSGAISGQGFASALTALLAPKIKALAARNGREPQAAADAARSRPHAASSTLTARSTDPARVLVIASSTGGPDALATVLPGLPADLGVPVLIVQHMPPLFTRALAERLDSQSSLTVFESAGDEILNPGCVYLAPGNQHLALVDDGYHIRTQLLNTAPENSCRPAADVLFRCAAAIYKRSCLAVVLTGMGQDGLLGARAIVAAGGRVLAQSGPTCVVWGMPKAVEEAGICEAVVPLEGLAAAISSRATPRTQRL